MKQQTISTVALALLITGAIDSIRNLPTTALFGGQLVFYFVLAACFFLIPVALVAAELASTYDKAEGGIYHWVNMAYGENIATIAIWLQWINTLVWFPTILSFIAGTIAYLINPILAQNKLFLFTSNLIIFWGLTLINLRGIKTSANFASVCAMVGMIFPMILIIGLALFWIFGGHPLAVTLNADSLTPKLFHAKSWVSLTAMMTAFLGMELASVHVRAVNNPGKNFPKAMMSSVLIILTTMICGSLAIAFVIPAKDIHLVDGVMQAFEHFFQTFHLGFLTKPIALLLVIGSLGGMVNWIISPTKGMMIAASKGYLPKRFETLNQFQVASPILLIQAVLVSLISLLFIFMPNINEVYWFLTDLSTELYMFMYILLFLAGLRLKQKTRKKRATFTVPGGKKGFGLVSLMGLIGTGFTIVVGFFSPDETLNIPHAALYPYFFGAGLALMISPVLYLLHYKKKHSQN